MKKITPIKLCIIGVGRLGATMCRAFSEGESNDVKLVAVSSRTKESLEKLIRLIKKLKELSGMDVIYPMHPRTAAKLSEFGLKVDGARIIEPVGYLDSLALQMNADLVVTDSGGMQEEACILGVPCITIRENTERPETVEAGANRIVGLDVKLLEEAIECHRSHNHDWKNPFGDGKAAERIVNIIEGGKI